MLKNVAIQELKLEEITIEGYSRAAVQSYWRIPEWKIGFDLGAHPWDFMGTGTWFVSHTHLDHIAALPAYVARRRMMKMEPPVIHVPEAAIGPIDGASTTGLLRCRKNRNGVDDFPALLDVTRAGTTVDCSRFIGFSSFA